MTTASTVVVDGLNFPEAPRWFGDSLWFSDMRNGSVHVLAGGDVTTVFQTDDNASGLGFLSDGRALVVSVHNRQIVAFRDGESNVYADLGHLLADRPDDFLNDMLVRPDGSLYVGTRTPGLDPDNPGTPTDTLVYVPPEGAIDPAPVVAARHLSGVNGMVELDGELVVAETYGGRLTAFRTTDSGALDSRREYSRLSDYYPDGTCADREGGIWLGSAYSGEVVRVDSSGTVTDVLRPQTGNAVACVLGGEDGHTLFVCTAELSAMQRTWIEETHSFSPAPTQSGTIQAFRVAIPGW